MEKPESRIRTAKHLAQAIKYIHSPEKTDDGFLIGSVNCTNETAYEDMMLTKQVFSKEDGRIAYHWNIDLPKGYGTPAQMMGILEDFTEQYFKDEYEVTYATHTDKDFIHGHIIFNSVSCITGKKFHYKNTEWEQKIVPLVNRLCMERGLPILDLDAKKGEKTKSLSYIEWLQHKKGHATWRDMITADVDFAVGVSLDYADFLIKLENMGYEVSIGGKHLKVKVPGMEKYARVYSLGSEYTEARINERIKNETPKAKQPIYKEIGKYRVRKEKLPKQKKHLSYFQRQYLKYMYMFGKIERHPYRHVTFMEKKQAERIAGQMNYVFFANIQSRTDLITKKTGIEKELMEIGKKQKSIYMERKKFRGIFDHVKALNLAKAGYEQYCEGHTGFEAEVKAYEENRAWLEKRGYTTEAKIQEIEAHRHKLVGALLPLREQKQKLQVELKTVNAILNEDTASLSAKWQKETERGTNAHSKTTDKEQWREQDI